MTTWHRPCESSTCVEILHAHGEVWLRQSDRPLEVVRFTDAEWAAFLRTQPDPHAKAVVEAAVARHVHTAKHDDTTGWSLDDHHEWSIRYDELSDALDAAVDAYDAAHTPHNDEKAPETAQLARCRAQYKPFAHVDPIARVVRCNRRKGHDGDHDEMVDGFMGIVTWPQKEVSR